MVRARKQDENSPNGSASTSNGAAVTDDDVTRQKHASPFKNLAVFYVFFPVFIMTVMPCMTILQWYAITNYDGSYLNMARDLWKGRGLFEGLTLAFAQVSINRFSVGLIAGYSLYHLVLMKLIPGPRVTGPITPKGNLPVYEDNGFYIYLIHMVTLAGLQLVLRQYGMSVTIVYDRFGDIILSLNVLSMLFCLLLYAKGLYAPTTNDCGSSGNFVFDYYWGTELYPRIFGWDIKVFTNCRFGLTAWPLLVTIFALKSYELHGFVDSMFVTTVIQMFYLTKFFWWEAGYLNTMDIGVDRAGFYLCWGCLAYVPCAYTVVSHYMVSHPVHLGNALTAVILTVGVLSVIVNYFADWQKQECRLKDGDCLIWGRRPDIIRAKYTTEDGETKDSVLLVDGYWAMARHFHYIPELMLAFCWTVPALFENILPYQYVIILAIILWHRTYRDDEKCAKKYGKSWEEYVRRVPCRLIPYVY